MRFLSKKKKKKKELIPKLLPFCCGKGLENRKTCRSGLGTRERVHGQEKSCLSPSVHVLFQSIISLSDHHHPEALGWGKGMLKGFYTTRECALGARR